MSRTETMERTQFIRQSLGSDFVFPEEMGAAFLSGDHVAFEALLAPISSENSNHKNLTWANALVVLSLSIHAPFEDESWIYLDMALRHGADPSLVIEVSGEAYSILGRAIYQDSLELRAIFYKSEQDFRLEYNKGARQSDYLAELRAHQAPLREAARRGEMGLRGRNIERLLAAGASINAPPEAENLVIVAARGQNHLAAIRLLGLGANPRAKSFFGDTPLSIASQGDIDMVDILLAHDPGVLNTPIGGKCALTTALALNQGEIARRLLDAGIDPNGPSAAWTVAVFNEDLDMLELLFEKGADIHATRPNGWSCLHAWAHDFSVRTLSDDWIEKARAQLCFLLDKGAEPTLKDHKGQLPEDFLHVITEQIYREEITARDARMIEGKTPSILGKRAGCRL